MVCNISVKVEKMSVTTFSQILSKTLSRGPFTLGSLTFNQTNKILDCSKLKAYADDKINLTKTKKKKTVKFVFGGVETTT